MKGLSDDEIIEIRANAVAEIMKRYECDDISIVNPLEITRKNVEEKGGLYAFGRSISMMAMADLVVFCENWDSNEGCLIEHKIAIKYNVPYVLHINDIKPPF